jgi:hypothetical protein
LINIHRWRWRHHSMHWVHHWHRRRHHLRVHHVWRHHRRGHHPTGIRIISHHRMRVLWSKVLRSWHKLRTHTSICTWLHVDYLSWRCQLTRCLPLNLLIWCQLTYFDIIIRSISFFFLILRLVIVFPIIINLTCISTSIFPP